MKNLISATLTILSLMTPAQAECPGTDLIAEMDAQDRAALYQKAAARPFPEGNLWRAEKPGSTIFVVGTFHLYDPRLQDMMTEIAPLLSGLDRLYTEASPEDTAALKLRMSSDADLLFLNDGPTLIDLLPPADWEELRRALQLRNIPGFMVARMQPWYAGLLLALPPCTLANTQQGGLDAKIIAEAQASGLEIRGLEDPETILAMLTGDPLHEQVEMLQIGLAMNADADAQFSTVVASYFRGEHRLLWEFSQDRMLRHPEAPENLPGLLQEIEYELLTRRNLAWAELLARETATGRYMVAAGAAHLSGEDGVLNLLARAGYHLTRLD